MLLYTVIQSPGYFVARHERAPVVMFAVLALLTIAAIVAHGDPLAPTTATGWRCGQERALVPRGIDVAWWLAAGPDQWRSMFR